MQWVQVGEPQVHRQRNKWVVRQSGCDPATGRRRVRQLGTHATKRAAVAQQRALAEGRAGTDTLGEYLEVWLRSKDGRVAASTFDQYAWEAAVHTAQLVSEPPAPVPERGLDRGFGLEL